MKDCAQPLQHIEHGIPPVFDERSEVLVLGTMPSPKSREAAFFYGHPQNRFWRVLAALFDEPVPEDNAERADLLLSAPSPPTTPLRTASIISRSASSIRMQKIPGSPKEVSEVPTGTCNSLEARPSGLRAVRESAECEGQVPVGIAASTGPFVPLGRTEL